MLNNIWINLQGWERRQYRPGSECISFYTVCRASNGTENSRHSPLSSLGPLQHVFLPLRSNFLCVTKSRSDPVFSPTCHYRYKPVLPHGSHFQTKLPCPFKWCPMLYRNWNKYVFHNNILIFLTNEDWCDKIITYQATLTNFVWNVKQLMFHYMWKLKPYTLIINF